MIGDSAVSAVVLESIDTSFYTTRSEYSIMKTQDKKIFRFKRGKLMPLLVLIGLAMLSFYTIQFRNDWVFGIKDTFLNKREGIELETVSYGNDQLANIELDELFSDSSEVKITNCLSLVNKKHKIDNTLEFNLVSFRDTSLLLDENVIGDLENLLQAVKQDTDEKVYIMSTYRTAEEQEMIYKQNPRVATPVNTSEHQTGLALDIYVYKKAQREFIDTDAGKWIHHNAWQHGFIIRYPFLKKHITGIGYEPWHIRYVGKPHGEIIYKNGWTLEEYINFLEEDTFYSVNGYVISRQSPRNGRLKIPMDLEDITLSSDNTGCYIITGKN